MKKEKAKIKRGEIYYADLGYGYGSKQGGYRPVLILQNNIGNEKSKTTIVAPLTKKQKKNIKTHVEFINNFVKQTVLLEQIFTLNISELEKRIGSVDENILKEIDEKLKISLGIKEG